MGELKDETIVLIRSDLVTLESGCFVESFVKIWWQVLYWGRVSCFEKSSWYTIEIAFLVSVLACVP